MKITYLHQYYVNPTQAGATRSYELARRLVALGHHVDMITTERSVATTQAWTVTHEDGIVVHRIFVPYYNAMNWIARVGAFLRFAYEASLKAAELDADVIFATSTPLTIAIPALYASWRKSIPYVFEIRDVWPSVPIAMGYLRNPLLRSAAYWLERTAYHRAKRLVALTPGMRQRMMDCGITKDLITIIPNGCDNQLFEGVSAKAIEKIHAHPRLGHRPFILYAGTFGEIGGASYVVDLAAATLSLDPEIRFVMIGEGKNEEKIHFKAIKLGVLDTNLLIMSPVSKLEIVNWFAASTMTLALFSGPRIVWKDAVQNKFFDSLAAGKPIISNHLGWQNEIAVQHDVGFSIPADDPAEAARMIVSKAHNSEWLQGVAERSRELAHGQFSREVHAETLQNILEMCVEL